jgi:hypothetical protein
MESYQIKMFLHSKGNNYQNLEELNSDTEDLLSIEGHKTSLD